MSKIVFVMVLLASALQYTVPEFREWAPGAAIAHPNAPSAVGPLDVKWYGIPSERPFGAE